MSEDKSSKDLKTPPKDMFINKVQLAQGDKYLRKGAPIPKMQPVPGGGQT